MKTRSIVTLTLTGALCLMSQSQAFAQQPEPEQESKKAPETPEDVDVDAELDALEAEVTGESADGRDAGAEQPSAVGQAVQNVGAAVQSMNPDISFILDAAGAWFSDSPMPTGGPDPSENGFNLQGIEMAVSADVDPFFRFDGAFVFHGEGVEAEEAYGSTLALPYNFGVRFGQYKTRFGRHNPTHLHTWRFVDQPLVTAKLLGPESMRGVGAEVSRLELWMPGTFRWYASYQNIAGLGTGPSFVPDGEISGWEDLTANARIEDFVEISTDWDLLLGASYANGPNKWGVAVPGEDANQVGSGDRSQIFGADAYLHWRSRSSGGRTQIGWQTEALLRQRQIPGGSLVDWGLYSWLEFRPDRYWGSALRYGFTSGINPSTDGGPIFADANPIDAIDPTSPDWMADRHRVSAQISYYASHFSKLRLQYNADYLPGINGEGDQLSHSVFIQAELVTGAHGAHSY